MMLFLPSLDILTCNSANKQSFQNPTKGCFISWICPEPYPFLPPHECRQDFKRHYVRNPGGLRNHYEAFLQNKITLPAGYCSYTTTRGSKRPQVDPEFVTEITCPYGTMPLKFATENFKCWPLQRFEIRCSVQYIDCMNEKMGINVLWSIPWFHFVAKGFIFLAWAIYSTRTKIILKWGPSYQRLRLINKYKIFRTINFYQAQAINSYQGHSSSHFWQSHLFITINFYQAQINSFYWPQSISFYQA